MKVAFLGNFNVSYSSESHYLKTLQDLGHEVFPLQEGKATAAEIMQRAINCDALFWVHTHGWFTPGIAEGLEELKALGIPSFGYHLDLWKGLGRMADLENDPYWGIEYFFTVDPNFVVDLQALGIKADYLPAGVFADECFLGQKKSQYEHDVVFIGSRGYHSEWPYREQLISHLEQKFGDRFAHYGGGSSRGNVRGAELNDVLASAKVVVGDTLCPHFDYPGYYSDRVFETTGRGGFIIHPYIKGIESCFPLPFKTKGGLDTSIAGIVTYPYRDFGYLDYAIEYFLKNENEREAIRLRGFETTKEFHTYRSRMDFILKKIMADKNTSFLA